MSSLSSSHPPSNQIDPYISELRRICCIRGNQGLAGVRQGLASQIFNIRFLRREWQFFNLLMSRDELCEVYLLERKLVLTPDQAGRPFSAKCNFVYQPQNQAINFALTLQQLTSRHCQLSALLDGAQLFYVDERARTKHFLGEYPLDEARMLFEDWTTDAIVISYRKHEPPPTQAAPLPKQASRKSRERTIKEVRAQIERWRQVAKENQANGGKGISLLQAARQIGISKKSLDDYLRCLRMGEKLSFDFSAFQSEKIGFLRAYVREKLREPVEESKMMNEIDSYWDSTYVSKDFC